MTDDEIDQLVERVKHRASNQNSVEKEKTFYLDGIMQILAEIAKRMPCQGLSQDVITEVVWEATKLR